jgi:hypothetical protein
MRSTAEKIADEIIPEVKARKGFKSVASLEDDEAGKYGSFILWESREDAEAAKEALFPILQNALTGIAKDPPTIRLFEAYEPKE